MNIGSRVRLLHGREEGVITRIKSGKYLEVDLGDGFSIPLLASEVVLISPMESKLEQANAPISQQKAGVTPRSQPFVSTGIYLAFVPINDREIVLHLVNLTSWKLLFTIFGRHDGHSAGLASGVLEREKSHQITKLLLKDFESWPVFETSLLFYSEERAPAEPVFRHSLRCRIRSFHNHLQKAPLLGVNAHVFQLDPEATAVRQDTGPLSASEIRDRMLGQKAEVTGVPAGRTAPEIDLHAEALAEDTRGMSTDQILATQLSAFKAYLEKAIAEGREEVTVIHGVGQGVLRQEIHRTLSRHPNVAYYKDAKKEKFGYGATVVHLK